MIINTTQYYCVVFMIIYNVYVVVYIFAYTIIIIWGASYGMAIYIVDITVNFSVT